MPDLPAPDDLVALPVEVVALGLLQRLDESGGEARNNFIGLERSAAFGDRTIFLGGGQPPQRPRADPGRWEQKLHEAFDWLYVNGLIATDATQASNSGDWYVVSELGRIVLDRDDGCRYLEAQRFLSIELHPSIDGRVRQQFLLGELEAAVSLAWREVEIRVREAAGLDDSLVGVKLMREAYKPSGGALTDDAAETSEREGILALFAGGIGAFRNPVSHRRVDYDDPTEAVEVILFADLLLRITDRAESR